MGSPHVAAACIADHAYDLEASTREAVSGLLREPPADGFSPRKHCFTKASLTIATPGYVSLGRKSRPSIKGNLHCFCPAGRDTQKVGQTSVGALFTQMKLFQPVPLSSGHPASATVSTP